MESNTLAVTSRTVLKKSANKNLRKEGRIPAVIYGHGVLKNIAVYENEFEKKFHNVSENTIITLLEDGKAVCDVLLKDYQEDIVKQKISHIDFYEVEKDKVLKTKIPVYITGAAPGVRAGGLLEQIAHEIEVECLPGDIPEKITVNIDKLEIGQTIHLGDIDEIPAVKFLSADDLVLVHIVHAKAVAVETSEEEEEAEEEKQGE